MSRTSQRLLSLCLCLLIPYCAGQASGGYAAYAGAGSSSASTGSGSEVLNSVPSGGGALAPAPPLAPPRVPLPETANIVGPSLGYRPPPPPVRRDAESSGKCSFDSSKWTVEPQSAIAGAIMFDRTTGLSCEECLEKCIKFQDPSSKWVCRSLTYDHRWKICDLFAIDGTAYPYFLTEYEGRDYFAYQAALPPTDDQLSEGKTADESDSDLLSKSGANKEEKAQSASVATQTENQAESTNQSKAESGAAAATEAAPSQGAQQAASAASQGAQEAASAYSSQGTQQTSSASSQGAQEAASASLGSSGSSSSVAAEQKSNQQSSSFVQETSVQQSSSSQTVSTSYSSSSSSSSQREVSPSGAAAAEKTVYKAVHGTFISKSGANVCQTGEVAHYADFSLHETSSASEETESVPAKTREECLAACELEESTSCASANYSPSGCKLSISRANHSDPKGLSASSSGSYLEKVCIPRAIAKGLKKVFDAVPRHILVGHVQEVADASSIKECISACLRAEKEYGFECKSVMWYPTDASQNCLLNTESRHTQPDVFVNEDQGVVMVYLDVPRDSALKDNSLTMRFKDSPLSNPALSKWTRWSMCSSSGDLTAMRHRYLKCTTRKDIRKCPKESVMCGHLPTLQIQKLKGRKDAAAVMPVTEQSPGICYAVKDSRGRKRCPHGLRLNAEGRREYCREPVDC